MISVKDPFCVASTVETSSSELAPGKNTAKTKIARQHGNATINVPIEPERKFRSSRKSESCIPCVYTSVDTNGGTADGSTVADQVAVGFPKNPVFTGIW